LSTASALLIPKDATEVHLHVGLPMNYFADENAEKLHNYISDIDSVVEIKGVKSDVKFGEIEIKPQGIGGYFDIVFDWNGRVRNDELSKASIGMINIGYRTVEYLLARSGRNGVQFLEDKSGSLEKAGMNSFLGTVQSKILTTYDIELSKEMIERIIFFDECVADTKKGRIDITSLVEDAKSIYTSDVISMIKPSWGSDEETLKSIFLGGGSAKYLFDNYKESFPNLVLHGKETESEKREDAHIFSNAYGFLKMWLVGQHAK